MLINLPPLAKVVWCGVFGVVVCYSAAFELLFIVRQWGFRTRERFLQRNTNIACVIGSFSLWTTLDLLIGTLPVSVLARTRSRRKSGVSSDLRKLQGFCREGDVKFPQHWPRYRTVDRWCYFPFVIFKYDTFANRHSAESTPWNGLWLVFDDFNVFFPLFLCRGGMTDAENNNLNENPFAGLFPSLGQAQDFRFLQRSTVRTSIAALPLLPGTMILSSSHLLTRYRTHLPKHTIQVQDTPP